MAVDERIALAVSLYEPSKVGADIGTDHAYLPAELLRRGICERMLLCDVSPSALDHARQTVTRLHLEKRAALHLTDGLYGLTEPCGCVSVMGMGGETMAGILTRGADRLQGAVLVLSAHTEQEAVRRAVRDIGYHFTREVLCEAAGRLYLMWRAEPGEQAMTEEAIRRGSLLWQGDDPLASAWARKRLTLLEERLRGFRLRGVPEEELAELQSDMAFYQERIPERK